MLIRVWTNDFKNENEKTFKQAINRIRYKSKYMPSIAEIKEEIAMIKNTELQLDLDNEWCKVLKLISKYGADFEDDALKELNPYAANVVKMIGWRYLCQSPITQRQWNEKEFKTLMQNKNINLTNYEVIGINATDKELTYREQLLQEEQEIDRINMLEMVG